MHPLLRRTTVAALAAGFGLSVAAATGDPDTPDPTPKETTIAVPFDEARAAAVAAGLTGNMPLADTLATELLKANPDDPDALLAKSTVFLSQRAWDEAYKASKTAFRFSGLDVNRYHAARVAAAAAVADKRVLRAQYWLRRAGDFAPGPVQRRALERNFALLRSENPLSYKFRFSATPSSNVNGGTDSLAYVIDDLPTDGDTPAPVGLLDPARLALSGIVASANVDLSYRLKRTDTTLTALTGGVFLKRVALTEDAPEGFNTALLGSTALSFGVSHTRAIGAEKDAILRVEAGLRDSWVDMNRTYTALTGKVVYARKLSDTLHLTTQANLENRFYTDETQALLGSATAALTYRFPGGASLSGLVSYAASNAKSFNNDSTSWVGRLTYDFGKPVVEGVELSASLGATRANFPNYTVLHEILLGTQLNGRTDDGIFVDLEATLTEIEFAGFSPQLRVRRAVTESNISEFDTKEWSVSVGVQSNF